MELIIEKAKDIRITKVKPFAIFFDYADKKYLLHLSSTDCEKAFTLFERKMGLNGMFELERIAGTFSYHSLNDYIEDSYKGVYNQLDTFRLARMLSNAGLIKFNPCDKDEKWRLEFYKVN